MSRIDDLIAELCPAGVPFQTLGELGSFYGGLTGKSKADVADGNERFITYMNVYSNLAADVDPPDLVAIRRGERQNRVALGDVFFASWWEGAEECGMPAAVTVEPPEPLYLNSFCFGFRPNDLQKLDPEFSKHLFRSIAVRRQIVRTA